MASPMAHAYCTLPMGDGYCSTPVPVLPARPTAAHPPTNPAALSNLDMTGITILVAVLMLAARWRIRHT